ncbi:TolC family protein [Granulicella sp. WH15]|nr:TolC family protein [Granulicella sp. WH15]
MYQGPAVKPLLRAAAMGCVLTSGLAFGQNLAENHVPADLPAAPSAVARLEVQAGSSSSSGATPVAFPTRDHATPDALPLSLDDAIKLGELNNTQLAVQKQQERYVAGQILTVGNALLPDIQASAYSRAQEIDLVALGFKPSALAGIDIPGFTNIVIPEIVKVNTTNAQVSLSQTFFNVPAYFLYRAARKAGDAAAWDTKNQLGNVVLNVGTVYLEALADQAQIDNARALVKQDELVLEHARASQAAGVGVHIDVLRAQVQLQQEQQTLIADENAFAKDKIALNRAMGIAADQQLILTDKVPFASFEALSIDDARALAYTRRKDLLSLTAQLGVADETRKAVRYQYLPTVGVSGYYGVLGVTGGSYHGDFTAIGSLKFPIFQEGQLRGEREVASAQLTALRQQIAGLKTQIEAEIRTSMLDVQSSAELVNVARSNVALSQQELDDATLRFTAGVDDNLAVVRAQASLAGAQARVVQSEFQYNQAKLELARRTGVVETQYKQYLGH